MSSGFVAWIFFVHVTFCDHNDLTIVACTILCKIFWGRVRNQVKLDLIGSLWYPYMGIFLGTSVKVLFLQWRLDTRLCCHAVLRFIWYFRICFDAKSWVDQQLVRRHGNKFSYTGYQVMFYLWLIESILKLCKNLKY